MLKKYTCIVCPNGCDIEAEVDGKKVISVSGAGCKQGRKYIEQEAVDPRRNIASSVLLDGDELPLLSVRTSKPIPKDKIFEVIGEIKKVRLKAPVKSGQIIIADLLGLGVDIIATRTVKAR